MAHPPGDGNLRMKTVVWGFFFLGIFLSTFLLVQKYLPNPYMDEIFHIPQTLQYINQRDFITWDPKITTPPGLYYIGYVSSFLTGSTVSMLRVVNLAALILMLVSQPTEVAAFPLLAFYANLYYTDVWSTFLVVSALARQNSADAVSALLFFASLWFRQTNIIWLGVGSAFSVLNVQGNRSISLGELFSFRAVRTLLTRVITAVSPLIYLVVALFAAFIKHNGGITLGDKSNHQVALHGAQMLYYLAFFGFFSAPMAAEWAVRERNLFRRIYLIPLEIAAIWYVVQHGTIAHPFILADNRHYTFYIWRRLITPLGGKAIIPLYWGAWRWFCSTVQFNLVSTWVYLAAVVAVLVPSPLMEPRYYIVPYLVWRQFLYRGKISNKLELAWYAAIEIGTVAIFALSRNHFMW